MTREQVEPYHWEPRRCPCGPDSRVGGLPDHHPGSDCPTMTADGLLCEPCAAVVWAILDSPASIVFRPTARERQADADQAPPDPERQKRQAAALAYVASYTGTWGLPLDIKADRRFGTKYMRLSDKQIEALLAGKARDDERAAAAADPRQVAARAWLMARYSRLMGRSGFLADMAALAGLDRTFTPRQLETLERIIAEDAAREATLPASPTRPQDGPGRPFVQVGEGWYRMPDGTPVRVHKTRDGQRLYAERLEVEDGRGHWVYEAGLIRRLTDDQRMTLEDAVAFGKLYGICAVCGAYLVAGDSVERGIGPICAGRLA